MTGTTLHPVEVPTLRQNPVLHVAPNCAPIAGSALPRVLRTAWIASGVMFSLMFVVGFVRWRAGAAVAHYNPLSGKAFPDLLEYLPTFRLLHTAAFFHPAASPVAYPPFAAVVYAALYATGRPALAFTAITVAWVAVLTVGVSRWLRGRGVARAAAWILPLTMVLMAFPFEAMLWCGNLELFLWMFTATGVWAFCHGRPRIAAVMWGFAAAMKLFPLVLLVLLWPRRQFRAMACGLVAFAGVSLLSLWFLGPTVPVAFQGSVRNVFGYQNQRVSEWTMHELASNHSAFTLVKFVLRVCNVPFPAGKLPYYACGALLFAAVYFGRVVRLPRVNQVLLVTVFMLLLPPISYAHTLLHLFAPLVLLVRVAMEAERRGEWVAGLNGTLLLMAPLSGSFMLLTERRFFLFGGLVQGVLLLLVFYRAARYPFAVEGPPPPSLVALNC